MSNTTHKPWKTASEVRSTYTVNSKRWEYLAKVQKMAWS